MKTDELLLRDYFAAQAMLTVSMETQETRIASFWDWIKNILKEHLYCSFLTVNFVSIEGSYEKMAKKSYALADAMMKEREKNNQ